MRRLVLIATLTACSGGDEVTPTPDGGVMLRDAGTVGAGDAPRDAGMRVVVEAVPCRIPLPDDVADAFCFDHETHEAPDDPSSPVVTLHVVVFGGAPSTTPVVLLQGGPGLTGASYIQYLDAAAREARFGERRLVYVEQRGVDASRPALDCGARAPSPRCVDDLRAEGITFERYGAAHAADDVASVLDALGHAEAFVVGGSFGSRLGLEILRRHPERVRAAYLESLIPPDVDFLGPFVAGTDVALDELFAACAASAECATAFPDPDADLDAAYARAAMAPVSTLFGPATPDLITFALLEALYHQDLLATIPAGVSALATGNSTAAEAFIDLAFSRPPRVERLVYQTVLCVDVAPLFVRADYDAFVERVRTPMRPALAQLAGNLEICDALGVGAGPWDARTAVISDRPVLLVQPGIDGRSPRSNLDRVASTLSNAQIVTLAGRAHTPALGLQYEGAFFDACAASILRAFLEAPEAPVDASCASPADIDWALP